MSVKSQQVVSPRESSPELGSLCYSCKSLSFRDLASRASTLDPLFHPSDREVVGNIWTRWVSGGATKIGEISSRSKATTLRTRAGRALGSLTGKDPNRLWMKAATLSSIVDNFSEKSPISQFGVSGIMPRRVLSIIRDHQGVGIAIGSGPVVSGAFRNAPSNVMSVNEKSLGFLLSSRERWAKRRKQERCNPSNNKEKQKMTSESTTAPTGVV